jgi:anti-sigma B factor antagonist
MMTDVLPSSDPGLALAARRYRLGCWLVIEPDGEVDMEALPLLQGLLYGNLSHLLFDLRRVTFMDASGLGVIAASRRNQGQAHGAVRVAGPTRQVRKLFEITSLDRAVPVFDSLAEASSGHVSCW